MILFIPCLVPLQIIPNHPGSRREENKLRSFLNERLGKLTGWSFRNLLVLIRISCLQWLDLAGVEHFNIKTSNRDKND